jgi:hypothetical protein
MRRITTFVDSRARRDPRTRFGAAWLAAFLSLVLIIGAAFWAAIALR